MPLEINVKRFLRKAHIYLGTLLALPLLVISATGILLGVYDQLRYAGPPYRLESPAQAPLPAAALADRVRTIFPGERLAVLFLPTASDHAARAKLMAPEGSARLAFLDPESGHVLALKPVAEQDWLDFLYDLHRGKPLGLTGQIIASITGVSVLLLWGAGFWLTWRRAQSREKVRLPVYLQLLKLHRQIGLWLGGLLAALAVVGAALNFAGPLIQRFDPEPHVVTVLNPGWNVARLGNFVEIARAHYPGVPLERIYFPVKSGEPWGFRFQDGSWVFSHPESGQVLAVKTSTSHWTRLLYPLHSGRLFGTYGPVFMAGLGFLLLGLTLTGLVYWRRAARRATP